MILSEDLVQEIDKIAGSRGRSAFLAELARREIKRRRLLEIFKREEPIWKDEDHPELRDGAAESVRRMRDDADARFQGIERHRENG